MTNMRLQWRTRAVFSTSGPTIIPGVSHRNRTGHVEGVAELHEAGGLVGPVAVDGPAQVRRVVGEDAHRPALDAGQGRDHARRRSRGGARAPSRCRPGRRSPCARRRRGGGSRGWRGAAGAGRRTPTRSTGPWKYDRYCLAAATASASSATAMSTTPLGTWYGHRADLLGPVDAETAALDHGRAAHADVRVLGGDDHVAAAEQRGVAGEAAPGGDAHQRHEAAQPAEEVKAMQSRPATPIASVSPGRPPPPSVKNTTGSRQALGQLEQPVLLAVVLLALGAGQHGVVVRHDDAAGVDVVEQVAVHRADAGDQAVGRGAARSGRRAVRRRRWAAMDQRPVLDERARVAQVLDVLAGRALAGLPPALDGVGPGARRARRRGGAAPRRGRDGCGRGRGRRRRRRRRASTSSRPRARRSTDLRRSCHQRPRRAGGPRRPRRPR